jgi:hypothetical protein
VEGWRCEGEDAECCWYGCSTSMLTVRNETPTHGVSMTTVLALVHASFYTIIMCYQTTTRNEMHTSSHVVGGTIPTLTPAYHHHGRRPHPFEAVRQIQSYIHQRRRRRDTRGLRLTPRRSYPPNQHHINADACATHVGCIRSQDGIQPLNKNIGPSLASLADKCECLLVSAVGIRTRP